MLLLGIESSCDETAAAVVANGRDLRSSAIASSLEIHRAYGGVVPELASRAHLESIIPVIDSALREAGCSMQDMEAVAVTVGPGLIGSLLVGVSAAKMLAAATGKPLVPVHHLAGHLAANYLAYPSLTPPYLALLVSGAHSHLMEVQDYTRFQVLGRTRDDAPGEAFDKIARVLGLPYPGGPEIDRLASRGDPQRLQLPRPRFPNSLDFSFSGLKTAVLNEVNRAEQEAKRRNLPRETILASADAAAAFQENLCYTLVEHSREAVRSSKHKRFALAGGVSANRRLREMFEHMAEEEGLELFVPPIQYCTDNAAMIASQAYYAYRDGQRAEQNLNARAVLEL